MTHKRIILTFLVGLLGLSAATLFFTSTAGAAALPPRPTPGPTPTAIPVVVGGQPGQGAAIELRVPGAESAWWIVVQWQDTQKNWNTVAGWQGIFDEIKSDVGSKSVVGGSGRSGQRALPLGSLFCQGRSIAGRE